MHISTETRHVDAMTTTPRLWAGRIAGGLALLFLGVDAAMKIARHPAAVEGTVSLGYPESAVQPIGVLALFCWLLYAVPRTRLLGAVLWTGYLGGAISTHVRLGSPLISHTLFPVYVAALLWGSLYLLEPRLRTWLPLRRD